MHFWFDFLTILIHHFALFFQYPQSKKEILCQKEKQYIRILYKMDIYFKRLIIYHITMNISNT